eukprot:7391582-Prymnesium_polylepis.3
MKNSEAHHASIDREEARRDREKERKGSERSEPKSEPSGEGAPPCNDLGGAEAQIHLVPMSKLQPADL